MNHSRATRPGRPDESGFVLLAVVLISALMVSGVAGYARHALMADRHKASSHSHQLAAEAALSGVVYVRQGLAAGTPAASTAIPAGDGSVNVTVADSAPGHQVIRADATKDGLGAVVLAEVAVYPMPTSAGGTLPALVEAISQDVRTSGGNILLADGTNLSDVVLTGTVIIASGASVDLNNVVVHGSIVSQTALDGPPYLAEDATVVRTNAGLRVEPDPTLLPGLAVFLPDGAFTAGTRSRVELNGAVVAHSLTLSGEGAIHGNTSADMLVMAPEIDLPGSARTPLAWPAALEHTHLELSSVAFLKASVASAEKQAITGFAFD